MDDELKKGDKLYPMFLLNHRYRVVGHIMVVAAIIAIVANKILHFNWHLKSMNGKEMTELPETIFFALLLMGLFVAVFTREKVERKRYFRMRSPAISACLLAGAICAFIDYGFNNPFGSMGGYFVLIAMLLTYQLVFTWKKSQDKKN